MPWKERPIVSQRKEFVALAQREESIIRQLCVSYEISPNTAYKWLRRAASTADETSFTDQSRRPKTSPTRTPEAMEQAVLAVRDQHPAWGGRKIRAWLLAHGSGTVPSASTVTAILHRHQRIDPEAATQHRAWQRFEHAAPNRLLQMDFKGDFALSRGRCYPLTVLDDHSRFVLGLVACGDTRASTVQGHLTDLFRRYGLPERMTMDNGSPWGAAPPHFRYTRLTVWLLQLDIKVSHSRPYHPQTQGKDERFHRTLKAEVLQGRTFADLASCQQAFDHWRAVYNLERPHEALGLQPPISRYAPSPRPFPDQLPAIEYDSGALVRKVQNKGEIWLNGTAYLVGDAFQGHRVALRPGSRDGTYDVFFGPHHIALIDIAAPRGINVDEP